MPIRLVYPDTKKAREREPPGRVRVRLGCFAGLFWFGCRDRAACGWAGNKARRAKREIAVAVNCGNLRERKARVAETLVGRRGLYRFVVQTALITRRVEYLVHWRPAFRHGQSLRACRTRETNRKSTSARKFFGWSAIGCCAIARKDASASKTVCVICGLRFTGLVLTLCRLGAKILAHGGS